MMVHDAAPSKGLEITGIQLRLGPLCFMHLNSHGFIDLYIIIDLTQCGWKDMETPPSHSLRYSVFTI